MIDRCANLDKCILNAEYIMQNLTLSTLNPTEECFGDSSFFVQIPCTIDETEGRQIEGLLIGCMGVFIALFFVSYIDYMKSVFKSTAVEWDVKTITAGDYSVEVAISKGMWNTF